MALRDQPYLPLYVQDYLTDEKLNECSAAAQGVYIKIMCILHKSEKYGQFLLKQNDKQNDKQILNFACKFARHLTFPVDIIANAITELLDNAVLTLNGDILLQKRMVRDNEISIARSIAGKKGGEKTFFAQAKGQANTENENEYEIDIDNKNDNEKENTKKETPLWKQPTEEGFQEYIRITEPEFDRLMENWEWISEQKEYYPGVSIRKSVEKAWGNFWGTKAGWENRRKKKAPGDNWPVTVARTIKMNLVYWGKNEEDIEQKYINSLIGQGKL